MKISSQLPANLVPGGQSGIDQQIQQLNKRKQAIFEKITDVLFGDDDQKTKEEKIEALRMEISYIDLQIQQLMRKKMEKQKQNNADIVSNSLPPSPSELIHPDRQPQQKQPSIDFTV